MTTAPPPALYADLLERPRTLQVEANGVHFTYLEWGKPDGPLVLCLHGFPDTPETWKTLGPVLGRAGYRVVAPYTRGYYPTDLPARDDEGAATLGQDAIALIQALGAEKAVVIGHDWGALAAYAANSIAPQRISRLVLVAIPHPSALAPSAVLGKASHFLTLPLPGAVGAFEANDVSGVDRILRKWSPNWHPTPETLDAIKRPFRHPGGTDAILGYYRAFARDQLQVAMGQAEPFKFTSVAQPALVVYGDADGALDPAFFDKSRPYFTGPYTALSFHGAGHFPQSEDPGRFAEAVKAFLATP